LEDVPSVCPAGKSLQIVDSSKSLCLHLKGYTAGDGSFAVTTTVRQPMVTMPCAAKSTGAFANQVRASARCDAMSEACANSLTRRARDRAGVCVR
jgi:hypothetical protein